ncbi:MAG: hypothetical protein COB60_04260 [Flavobacteriaceae bacterium]|nr:MAG: hypothetical protein COB60_04260 [Flavobacteriaceae bacterium]
MTIIENIAQILFIGIVIFIWNKYAVRNLIKEVVEKNPKNEWLANNQTIITKGSEGFYWAGYGMFIISILLSNFK